MRYTSVCRLTLNTLVDQFVDLCFSYPFLTLYMYNRACKCSKTEGHLKYFAFGRHKFCNTADLRRCRIGRIFEKKLPFIQSLTCWHALLAKIKGKIKSWGIRKWKRRWWNLPSLRPVTDPQLSPILICGSRLTPRALISDITLTVLNLNKKSCPRQTAPTPLVMKTLKHPKIKIRNVVPTSCRSLEQKNRIMVWQKTLPTWF